MPNNVLANLVQSGGVGPVWSQGQEILRRIFVTVRDRNWLEVAPSQFESVIDPSQRTATLTARHTSDLVDFQWQGALTIGEDLRTLRFSFVGTALRDMDICRLGLVVLHPVESLVGSRLTVADSKNEHHHTIADAIAPQPIASGIPLAMTEPFCELIIERADFGVLELHFTGDLFELEDQRNWGDASFKTYCTPLRLGFPRAIKSGTSVCHGVEMRFTPAQNRTTPPVLSGRQKRVSSSAEKKPFAKPALFPALGGPWAQAAKANWSHLHIDCTRAEDPAALHSLFDKPTSSKLEIALSAEQGGQYRPAALIEAIRQHPERIARVLIYGEGAAPPTATAIEYWHRQLDSSTAPLIPLLGATRGYFVEFNRSVPLAAQMSGIAFPLSSTVHGDDAPTIADNVATIRDMAETGRSLAQEIAVVPLALYYPVPATPRCFPESLLASWFAATLIEAAVAGVTSVTLADDVAQAIFSSASAVGPSFLQRWIEYSGRKVRPLEIRSPRGVHGMVLAAGPQSSGRVLAANVTDTPVELSIADTEISIAAFDVVDIEVSVHD